ncbi:hypothetical protein LTR08_004750 [Meristemomyces frigidus]|nr:hypothetical protein LTR08_004750 [Meristemomyces frigidus]
MANNNNTPDFRSVTGQMETLEPTVQSSVKRSASQQRQASSQSTSAAPPLRKQRSNNLLPLSSPSTGTSPQNSRNTSPARRDSRPQPLAGSISTQPSAAAIQRALSATNVPQLASGPVTDAVSRLPRASKSTGGGSGDTTPQWPQSPRIKSPPPSAPSSRRGSAAVPKKAESIGTVPSISVLSSTPQSVTPPPKPANEEPRRSEQQLQPLLKAPSRGPSGKSMLETVQENSGDTINEPPAVTQATADLKPLTKISEEDKPAAKKEGQDSDKHTQPGESGSESAGSKLDQQRGRQLSPSQPGKATSQPPPKTMKSGYASLTSAKSRQSEGKQNMTVETETVASIPQSALSAGDRSGGGRTDHNGSVRLRPSNETIRPKKERKKPSQKTRSITQGTSKSYTPFSPKSHHRELVEEDELYDSSISSTESSPSDASRVSTGTVRWDRQAAYSSPWKRVVSFGRPSDYIRTLSDRYLRKASSKADIFEARVASQVDEANTSDSDETFVYESNPPEPQRRPRHHSRTPSVTSSHSMADQQRAGIRSFGDMLEDRKVAGKRSMKFCNTSYQDLDSPDSKNGTVRSHQARHFGKFGRGGSHASMFDQDSPFTQASKLRSTQLSARHSRPGSPRSPQSIQQQRPSGLFGRKQEHSFDFDGEGADDERTPLVGTIRTPRSGTRSSRRNPSGSVRSIDEYYGVEEHSRCGRFGGCMLGLFVLIVVILSAIAFFFMSNRPMYGVQIHKIQNVLASEQEIMLDLMVGAVNPNALGISVGEMDINVFAKSKFVGNDPQWHDHDLLASRQQQRESRRRQRSRSVQPPTAKDSNADPWQDLTGHWHSPSPSGGVDRGTDPEPPDSDLEKDAQTMLLGRIFHFDQALAFEGSPIKRHPHYSVGELRLMRPGNKTEAGGSARWEQVLQHPFELIIRGVLRYQLPISMKMQSVSVGASVSVHPEDGVDEMGRIKVGPVKHQDEWQWIEWEDVEDVAHVVGSEEGAE